MILLSLTIAQRNEFINTDHFVQTHSRVQRNAPAPRCQSITAYIEEPILAGHYITVQGDANTSRNLSFGTASYGVTMQRYWIFPARIRQTFTYLLSSKENMKIVSYYHAFSLSFPILSLYVCLLRRCRRHCWSQ